VATNECKGLCVTNRSVSLAVAGALLCLVSVFLVGFFVGQRSAAQQFIDRAGQGAFADHIYAAMCGLSGTSEQQEDAANADGGETEASDEGQLQVTSDEVVSAVAPVQTPEATSDETETSESGSECYAQLIGFGTAKAAQDYANRLKKKGIPVFVQKRHSRSAKGRLVTWYQVITEKFRDEEKLQALIARLKEEEKLQGIHIVAC
jgi:septal ring-binding cell division protein DamX